MFLLNFFKLPEENSCPVVANPFQVPKIDVQETENQPIVSIDSFNPGIEAGANSFYPGTVAGAGTVVGANPQDVWLEAGADPEAGTKLRDLESLAENPEAGTELRHLESLAADPEALKKALKNPEALKKAINIALEEDPEALKSIVELESNLNNVGKADLPTILNAMEIGTLIKNSKANIPKEGSIAGANTEAGAEAGANPETRNPDLNSRDYTPNDARRLAVRLLEQEEGMETEAYWDHSRYSIGLGTESKPGERITREIAFERAKKYIEETIDPHLDKLEIARGRKFTLGQRAALISFFYNMGNNRPAVNKKVASGNDAELTRYLKVQDKGISGPVGEALLARRLRETTVYNGQIPKRYEEIANL